MGQRFRVASDVGGTFTDSIAYDANTRRITLSKVSTTPTNRALGTAEGLRKALALRGATGRDVAYVGHGIITAAALQLFATVETLHWGGRAVWPLAAGR